MTEKRKKVEEYILKTISIMDPSKTNTDRYKKIFESMDDKQFDSFMKQLRDKKAKLCLYAPNMKINLQTEDLYKAADKALYVSKRQGKNRLTFYHQTK